MDNKNVTEKKSLITENSTNYYTEIELIDNVIKNLETRTIIDRSKIVKTISYIQIPTNLKQKYDYNSELHSIINGFNGELVCETDGSIWIKLKRPKYKLSYGIYAGLYIILFLFYLVYYQSGFSGIIFNIINNSITN